MSRRPKERIDYNIYATSGDKVPLQQTSPTDVQSTEFTLQSTESTLQLTELIQTFN